MVHCDLRSKEALKANSGVLVRMEDVDQVRLHLRALPSESDERQRLQVFHLTE